MYPAQVGYYKPDSVNEALDFLEGNEAKVLAGGQSLIPMLKLRILKPRYLVDIGDLGELSFIREGETTSIGATTRHRELASRKIPGLEIIQETASKVGDIQVRNMGTVGGSLSNADPSADYPALFTALDATMVIRSRRGTREVKAGEFFKGAFTTALEPSEVLEQVKVKAFKGYRQTYKKLVRRAGDYALVGLALLLKMEAGEVKDVRIAFTGVRDRPHRPLEAENALKGTKLSDSDISKATELAVAGVNPPSDSRGSSSYRREVMKRLLRNTLEEMRREG
ncbi:MULTISPECIES: glyceraldehyde dehydrogenase subunit beta [Metallosphaera]|uniref:Glyceraldehyde oxidoreductase medium chain n=3 Tax=Metallosphaera TaxID=41980 RepID=A4YDH4_METS5|nr:MULTISPECIES: glyceraldehyde dehydrogenase subunit beta [Metallosphaera]ABP94476.1 glyceraldehyde oxidoreductase medium chain [Metallosphaera sedula DSM 5348]AIM26463.1 glyceraldehyde oxidoreductase medium chain [Metallosphaera sedula]AKV73461.1 carbon monoxide dehydrogenase [Metallosphaera sedula]AKV75703.1 carbon monoxide dehydrogenase [Metallosphaera sedula]AKV77950.1 carbon monoxide dehydrogenase [Metallosphaera sedula]